MNIGFSQLNHKQKQIFNIITGRNLYEKPILDQYIFNTDLVIKIKFPTSKQQQYINKNQFVPLSQFIYNPSKDQQQAYHVAYEKLIEESSQAKLNKDQKNIKIRNQVNFQQTEEENRPDKHYQFVLGNGSTTQITFPCYLRCKSTKIDFFTLKYNTLVYVLQKNCGFEVKSYIIQEEQNDYYVYLLVTQNMKNLMKAADRFRIKKQVDYSQLDLFLNEPVDSLGRPFQNNSQLMSNAVVQKDLLKKFEKKTKQSLENQKQVNSNNQILLNLGYGKERQVVGTNNLLVMNKKASDVKIDIQMQASSDQRTSQHLKKSSKMRNIFTSSNEQQSNQNSQSLNTEILRQNEILQLYKRVHRNMNDKRYSLKQHVIQQKLLSQREKDQIVNYMVDFFYQFDKILKEIITLDPQQKNYIYNINRNKINPKCEKEYILKLKRKKVFKMIRYLSHKKGHTTYKTPTSFFPFILPSKRLSFIERLRGVLLYEEYVVSPYGDMSLFSKMDRIKIAYLTLKENVRANNINKISGQIFALHTDFQRFGIVYQAIAERKINQNIKGGINGENLLQKWNPLTPWSANITTLRNYFGEDTTYQIYVKTHLIFYFIIITPLNIVGFLASVFFIYDEDHDTDLGISYKRLLIFHLVFFALTIGGFAYFLESWINKQNQFKENFMQNQTQKTFRYEFQGPFVRNNVTDSTNEHKTKPSLSANIKKLLFFLIIFIILAAECGIFYGVRMAIVLMSTIFSKTSFFLISWPHVLCYGLFFFFNMIFYRFALTKMTEYLTSLENLPTQDAHKKSMTNKNLLFLIGIQLIPLFFLLIIQPFAKTSCYASLCYDEVQQYIYTRYVIVFLFLGLKLINFVFIYFKSQISEAIIENQLNRPQTTNTEQKMIDYIKFIQRESQKPIYTPQLNDETLALLHYGMFAIIFPLCTFLALANLILQYSIERIQLIIHKQRPICKSEIFEMFSDNYNLIMHLSIFINVWIIFYTVEQVQYSFQRLIKVLFQDQPTYQGLLILKIIVILIVIAIFQLLALIVRHFVKQNENTMLNNRKKKKYDKHILHKNYMYTTKATIQVQKIHPFKTLFRTYHMQIIEKTKKVNKMVQLTQQAEDDISQQLSERQFLKNKEN